MAPRTDIERIIHRTTHLAKKKKRGASLVELITGMIYEGPQLIGEINMGLAHLLKKDGYASLKDAIGAYHGKRNQNNDE